VKLWVLEGNKDIFGANYDLLRKQQEQAQALKHGAKNGGKLNEKN
jgi:hypothetical protein